MQNVNHPSTMNPSDRPSELLPNCEESCTLTLAACVQSLGLDRIDRHLLICADQTIPKCCDKETSLEAWNYLKKRLQELQLDKPGHIQAGCIYRTKANCLRVCTNGPILVVYPDGVWYRNATPPIIERIIQEHLLGSQVVQEYVFLTHPLPQPNQGKSKENQPPSI